MRLTVRALGAQGDGLAEAPDGSPVFVPLSLPGETVTARVGEGRGEVTAIEVAAADRVVPPCPHFGDCGGCSLQHWAAKPYLEWKAERVREALAREGLEAEIAPTVATPPASRRRIALHARRAGSGVVLGFKARRSWRTVDLSTCVIADPALVAAFAALRRLAEPLLVHPKSAPTLHLTLTDSGLDIDVTGVERRSGGLSGDQLMQLGQLAAEADLARLTLGGELVYGARLPVVRLGRASVALPPGAFLQASPQAEAAMAAEARAGVQGARQICDLFCGVGTFTFPLAEVAPVRAVDGSAPAIGALKAALATAPGLSGITAQARDLFRSPLTAAEMKGVEAVVFDPPRAGALDQAAEIAASGASRVVAISCNPATFARDARRLVDGGFRLGRVVPIDQFLWSSHVELVAHFSR